MMIVIIIIIIIIIIIRIIIIIIIIITLAKYSCESTLVYGEHTIPSMEGCQQGIL